MVINFRARQSAVCVGATGNQNFSICQEDRPDIAPRLRHTAGRGECSAHGIIQFCCSQAGASVIHATDQEHLTILKNNASLAPSTIRDRKSTRLNSSHSQISYAVFCLKETASF